MGKRNRQNQKPSVDFRGVVPSETSPERAAEIEAEIVANSGPFEDVEPTHVVIPPQADDDGEDSGGAQFVELASSDLSHTAWIAFAASVAGGLAAHTGDKASGAAVAKLAGEAADVLVTMYQDRVRAGAL